MVIKETERQQEVKEKIAIDQGLNLNSEQTCRLDPLPFPVYFISRSFERWHDIIDNDELPENLDELYAKSTDSHDVWSPQTYLALKERGLNVHLVSEYVPGAICIATYDTLRTRDFNFKSYVVACQHDRGRPELCDERIVLNHLNVIDKCTDHFISQWPQPNLIPRDTSRGSLLKNLDFKGMLGNLAYPFQDPDFSRALKEGLDIDLRFKSGRNVDVRDFWKDYSQTDAILAIRNQTEYFLTRKPPIKLVNAWLAGVPAILGPEVGYQAMRQSELDYIEVKSPDEAIAALKKLKEQPKLYEAMVTNGLERGKEFSPNKIAEKWREVLAGPVADGYRAWMDQNPIQKTFLRPFNFAYRVLKHQQEKRYYSYHIQHGDRLFPLSPESINNK